MQRLRMARKQSAKLAEVDTPLRAGLTLTGDGYIEMARPPPVRSSASAGTSASAMGWSDCGAGMTFEGRLHSGKQTQPSHDSGLRFRKIQGMIVRTGIDDTRNIARIAIHLLRSGAGENRSFWFLGSSLESVSLGCSELANGVLGCSAGGECGRCGYERPPAVALRGAFADGDDCAECSRGGGATRCPGR